MCIDKTLVLFKEGSIYRNKATQDLD